MGAQASCIRIRCRTSSDTAADVLPIVVGAAPSAAAGRTRPTPHRRPSAAAIPRARRRHHRRRRSSPGRHTSPRSDPVTARSLRTRVWGRRTVIGRCSADRHVGRRVCSDAAVDLPAALAAFDEADAPPPGGRPWDADRDRGPGDPDRRHRRLLVRVVWSDLTEVRRRRGDRCGGRPLPPAPSSGSSTPTTVPRTVTERLLGRRAARRSRWRHSWWPRSRTSDLPVAAPDGVRNGRGGQRRRRGHDAPGARRGLRSRPHAPVGGRGSADRAGPRPPADRGGHGVGG